MPRSFAAAVSELSPAAGGWISSLGLSSWQDVQHFWSSEENLSAEWTESHPDDAEGVSHLGAFWRMARRLGQSASDTTVAEIALERSSVFVTRPRGSHSPSHPPATSTTRPVRILVPRHVARQTVPTTAVDAPFAKITSAPQVPGSLLAAFKTRF